MESASLEGVCERLKQEIAAELVTGPGKSWRCPTGLRSRIVSYARVCRERGEPLLEISNRLGLVESTLARWLRADRKELAAGFRSVSIVTSDTHDHHESVTGVDGTWALVSSNYPPQLSHFRIDRVFNLSKSRNPLELREVSKGGRGNPEAVVLALDRVARDELVYAALRTRR